MLPSNRLRHQSECGVLVLSIVETPNTVHGRLLEAVHISGYTFERACGELEWLLDEDRWKYVGGGFDDINSFLGTIDFSEFRIAIDQRKKLAKRLQAIEASQRATAKVLGVGKDTVARDLGERGANAPPVTVGEIETPEIPQATGANAPQADQPENDPAWFNTKADPSKDAKRNARNAERETEREDNRNARPSRPFPKGLFRLFYADPPWTYEHVKTESRAIENQYPTKSLDWICECPDSDGRSVREIIADDAVLYLWATSPKLAEAMRVIESWGFTYRTCAVWDKEKIGMGYYFRQQHELLLVAARGTLPVPEPSDRVSSVIRMKRDGFHSRKPVQVIELLESMYPDFGKKDRVELFTRELRAGWAGWGNEPEAVPA